MQRLLAPDGCPWDRKQSFATLRKYLPTGTAGGDTLTVDVPDGSAVRDAIAAGKTAKHLALDLKVKSAGAIKKSKCQGQVYSKNRKVVLVGKVMVNTKAGWGKVNKKGFKIPATSYRSFDVDCSDTYTSTCSNGLSWSVYTSNATSSQSISGGSYGKSHYSSAYRTVAVKGANGTSRISATASTPRFSISRRTLSRRDPAIECRMPGPASVPMAYMSSALASAPSVA